MSSSDSNARATDPWAKHYLEASQRRRARGWYRRDELKVRGRKVHLRLYIGAAGLFAALTIAALLLAR